MKGKSSILSAFVMLFLSMVVAEAQPQQLVGVGISLRESNGDFLVMGVVAGSPAEASGQIHAGDRILSVAQGKEAPVSTSGMKLVDLVDLIRGPKNSVVRLSIVPIGKTDTDAVEVRLTRSIIKLPAPQPGPTAARNISHREQSGLFGVSWSIIILLVAVPVLVISGYLLRRQRGG